MVQLIHYNLDFLLLGSNPLVEGEWFSEEENQQVDQHAATETPKLPISCVQRMIRKILPSHAKVTDESKEKIADCATEFISFITMEANQRCKEELRRTITAEDLIFAMGKLGFNQQAHLLTLYLHGYRQLNQEGGAGAGAGSSLVPILPRVVVPPPPPPPPPIVPNPMGTMGGIDVSFDDGLSGAAIGGAGIFDDGAGDGGSTGGAAADVYNDPIGYFNRQTGGN